MCLQVMCHLKVYLVSCIWFLQSAEVAQQDGQPLQAEEVLKTSKASALLPADEATQDSQPMQVQEKLQEAEPNALLPADGATQQPEASQNLPPGQQQITLRLQIVPSIKEVGTGYSGPIVHCLGSILHQSETFTLSYTYSHFSGKIVRLGRMRFRQRRNESIPLMVIS